MKSVGEVIFEEVSVHEIRDLDWRQPPLPRLRGRSVAGEVLPHRSTANDEEGTLKSKLQGFSFRKDNKRKRK